MCTSHELQWPTPPTATPQEILDFYTQRVHERTSGKGVIDVIGNMKEGRLHTAVLIADDENADDIEHQVHEAKFDVLRQWPYAPVRFAVYRNGEWLPPEVEAALLSHSI